MTNLKILLFFSLIVFSFSGQVLAKSPDKDKIQDREERRENILNSRAAVSGKLTGLNGTTLTLTTAAGKTVTVLTDSATRLRQRFWGIATLAEMQINDTLHVIGKWTDTAKMTLLAILVRDTSLQKRKGVFLGTVQSLMSNGFILQTQSRGNQTVTLSTVTKLVNRRGQTINQSQILVGNKIRVSGLWNKTNSAITEATVVRDLSLP